MPTKPVYKYQLTHEEKKYVERITRKRLGEIVLEAEIYFGPTEGQQAEGPLTPKEQAQAAYAMEIRDDIGNVMLIEAKYL